MIWIVLVLAVLCIAMSCVALWYREKWHFEARLRIDLQEEWRITDNRRLDLEFLNEQLGHSVSALNIEVDAVKERLKQSEFQCSILRREGDDKSKRIVALLDMNNRLRSQLPSRDSKGRFCKRPADK